MTVKRFKFEDPIYRGVFEAQIGGCRQAAHLRWCALTGYKPSATEKESWTHRGQDATVIMSGHSNVYVIWFYDFKKKNEWLAILAHEMAHIAINRFESIGLPITDDGSEAFCYYQQFLVKSFLSKLYK